MRRRGAASIAKRGEPGNKGGSETKFPSQEGREHKFRPWERENQDRERDQDREQD